ncbi:MAG: hypothetical protein F4X92_01445, partial [Gammaproteobacteria bacterium]|nr:hypothetical protein [Gammaproteobacteria bacterium]
NNNLTGVSNRTIFAKDCLEVLTDKNILPDESIDLIYLDPPFNSKSNYNLPFKDQYKKDAKPVMAFKDTWSWAEEEAENLARLKEGSMDDQLLADIVDLSRKVFKEKPNTKISTSAYLLNMAIRLKPMRRVLKSTGSIYLHCDPTASHYLKMVMDAIFGEKNFRNEIVWCYTGPSNVIRNFPDKHDIVFRYSKGDSWKFNLDDVRVRHRRQYVSGGIGMAAGNRTVEEVQEAEKLQIERGKVCEDWWSDIGAGSHIPKGERLGYPTQKPLALLERIIKSSSNEGDVVLDPFCGCGTTVHSAELLNRQWLGIDISQFSAGLIRNRITGNFKHLDRTDVSVVGCPLSLIDAHDLASTNPFEFEKWVCGEVGARGLFHNPGERGADGGVDGVIPFWTSPQALGHNKEDIEKTFAVVQVKGGKVTPDSVKALSTTVRESGGKCGVMICFEKYMNTVENNREKMFVEDWEIGKYNFIQGLSIEDLIKGKMPMLPSSSRYVA